MKSGYGLSPDYEGSRRRVEKAKDKEPSESVHEGRRTQAFLVFAFSCRNLEKPRNDSLCGGGTSLLNKKSRGVRGEGAAPPLRCMGWCFHFLASPPNAWVVAASVFLFEYGHTGPTLSVACHRLAD